MLILVKVLAQNDNFGFVRETCEFFFYLQLQQTKMILLEKLVNFLFIYITTDEDDA